MADTDAQIVESPITTAKVVSAMNSARAAVGISGPLHIASFNQGRSVIITASVDA